MKIFPILLTVMFLSASCANKYEVADNNPSAETPSYPGNTYAYRCGVENSYLFSARVDSSRAWLFLPGTAPVKTERSVSASGARFTSEDYLYWSKGDDAILETPEVIFPDCRIDREESTWEDAWIRGVDFRATGNEPGWHLELTRGEGIEYVLDYGTRTLHSVVPSPTTEASGETLYRIRNDEHTIHFVLDNDQCNSMSGKLFPISVELFIDDRSYRGCGKWNRYLSLDVDE